MSTPGIQVLVSLKKKNKTDLFYCPGSQLQHPGPSLYCKGSVVSGQTYLPHSTWGLSSSTTGIELEPPALEGSWFVFVLRISALQSCVVSAIQQCDSAISIHISPPS